MTGLASDVTTKVTALALEELCAEIRDLGERVRKLDETLALVVTHIGADNLNVSVAAREALQVAHRRRKLGYDGV